MARYTRGLGVYRPRLTRPRQSKISWIPTAVAPDVCISYPETGGVTFNTWTLSGGGTDAATWLNDSDDGTTLTGASGTTKEGYGIMTDVSDPGVDTGHRLICRSLSSTGTGSGTFALFQGDPAGAGQLIAQKVFPEDNVDLQDVTLELSEGEAALITDYTDLYWYTQKSGNMSVTIYGMWLEVPCASSTEITGVALTTTPTLPAGSLRTSLTGVVLTTTPSLPAGKLNTNLTGVVLTTTPSLPAGKLNTNVTGVVLTTTPSLPAGKLNTNVTGVVLTTTPSMPAGTLRTDVLGVALTTTPTLPAGTLSAGGGTVTGVTLTTTPTLPAGALATSITGVVLTTSPSLPAGSLRTNVTGIVLTTTPSLPAGSLRTDVTGVVLTTVPTLPAGSLTVQTVITGVVLVIVPQMPAGVVTGGQVPPLIDPNTWARFNNPTGTTTVNRTKFGVGQRFRRR